MSDLPKKGDEVRLPCVHCSAQFHEPKSHEEALYRIVEPVKLLPDGRVHFIGHRISKTSFEELIMDFTGKPSYVEIVKSYEEQVAERMLA